MSAGELSGSVKPVEEAVRPTPAMLAAMPMSLFFDGMAVNLHAEDCLDKVIKVGFDFPDIKEQYTYIIRRGVSEVVSGIAPDADIVAHVPAQTFKESLAKLRNPAITMAKDVDVSKGGKIEFLKFMALFQPPSK
jgi:alkyl sulfatase BDS1-like metallo-beta-lactamase superfamily hydrolase